MTYFLFVDESGHDHRASPYEVLAGIAIRDRDLWNVIVALHAAEERHFGRRYSDGPSELKGKRLLRAKVFHYARLAVEVVPEDVSVLARAALDDGAKATARHWKALALAKLAYVHEVFDICARFGCKAFASIVETDAHPTTSDGLRKDYAYLFERLFYFLEDLSPPDFGVIVFDELEKARSHILIEQARRYFTDSATGRHRASLILPEPLFIHSELTTGVQIADLIAYVVSWAFRLPAMTKPARSEMESLSRKVASLRYRAVRSATATRTSSSGASRTSQTCGRVRSAATSNNKKGNATLARHKASARKM